MLLARPISHQGLAGLAAATGSVRELQAALRNLATVYGRPGINPNSDSGEVDDSTALAVAQAFSIITDELPQWLYVTLQASLLIGTTTSFVKSQIAQYANILAAAVNAAAAKRAANQPAATLPVGPMMPIETPWYATPIGIGGIVLAAIVGYKIFLSK